MSLSGRVVYLLLSGLCFAGFGCGSHDPLIGNWTSSYDLGPTHIDEVATFKPDGTYQVDSVLSRMDTRLKLTVHDVGTWKRLNDNTYQKLLLDMNWITNSRTKVGAEHVAAHLRAKKATIISESNKHPLLHVQWEGQDRFVDHEPTGDETFIRKP